MATIEINGKKVNVASGQMIIEAADEAGIAIPRFCYHKKLSVAANCRMCLVEIDKARKPMPACATPVTDGMKVFTESSMVIAAQKAVMEFLLVNHPLDCPICDQGGECELQDLSMGYGKDVSKYTEGKRSVDDDNLGSLIATDMTRCIHCTRCVRFGEEVAGVRELGATGRGENTQIGTFVERNMSSEVSGNVIDLCPVGALTSKPYRFTSRPWELTQHASIAAHDCLGSNTNVHIRRDKIMRVVPKENESLNETWLSDRDRFSYTGLIDESRLAKPMIKSKGQWVETDWQTALTFAVAGMRKIIEGHGAAQFSAFCSPSSTTEEAYLLQKLMRSLGVNNLDHRLQQLDFSDQDVAPTAPVIDMDYAELELADTVVLIGSNIQREQPLAGIRVRKAARNGANVLAFNVIDYDYNFNVSQKITLSPALFVQELAGVVSALLKGKQGFADDVVNLLKNCPVSEQAMAFADELRCSERPIIVLGAVAQNHPMAATIRTLVDIIQAHTNAKIMTFTHGANAAGCWYAGMVPHRGVMGSKPTVKGVDVQTSLHNKVKGYLLVNVEPEMDIANPQLARESLLSAEFVVALSSYQSDTMLDYADVLLPAAVVTETSGTLVNIQNDWQSFKGLVTPFGESRPVWKILRVLANIFDLDGFDYSATTDVLDEVKLNVQMLDFTSKQWYCPQSIPPATQGLVRIGEWPMNRVDAVCRHAKPLQQAAASEQAVIRIHPITASRLRVSGTATISQGGIEITLPLKLDERVAEDAVFVANAMPETTDLAGPFDAITIKG